MVRAGPMIVAFVLVASAAPAHRDRSQKRSVKACLHSVQKSRPETARRSELRRDLAMPRRMSDRCSVGAISTCSSQRIRPVGETRRLNTGIARQIRLAVAAGCMALSVQRRMVAGFAASIVVAAGDRPARRSGRCWSPPPALPPALPPPRQQSLHQSLARLARWRWR